MLLAKINWPMTPFRIQIRNVFDKKDYAADGLPFSAKVKPHDVAFLVLTPAATAAKQH